MSLRSHAMIRPAVLIVASTLALALPSPAPAQPAGAQQLGEPGSAIVTVLSTPSNVTLTLEGPTEVVGHTPMDLPSSVLGRFSVVGTGPRIARTQGILFFPPTGEPPYLLSERPGMSPGLLVRSLNYPGLPNITAKRAMRGIPLALAATGGIVVSTAAHLRYRNRLDEPGTFAGIEAREERHARNAWAMYAGATWALSAVDYWIRPRFDVQEATPTRLSLVVPTVTRPAVLWRAIVVPGAGQDFANHRVRGALWLAGVLASGAGYTFAEGTVQQTKSDLARNAVLADSAGPTEQLLLEQQREVLVNDLKSNEDIRQGFLFATLGIYAASLIDALVLSIGPPALETPPRVSATFPIRPDGAGFAVTFRY